jgi:hypothetical protein
MVTAAVAGTVKDGDGDGDGSTTNAATVSIESGADERNELREGAPELQGDGQERSNRPGLGKLRRGENLPIPGGVPARFDPIPS